MPQYGSELSKYSVLKLRVGKYSLPRAVLCMRIRWWSNRDKFKVNGMDIRVDNVYVRRKTMIVIGCSC